MINENNIEKLLKEGKPLITEDSRNKFPKDKNDIELINYLLKNDISLSQIEKNMKEFPSQKTMRNRWEKLGFKYNLETKQLEEKGKSNNNNTVTLNNKKHNSNTQITLNNKKHNSNIEVTQNIIDRIEKLENVVFKNENILKKDFIVKSENDIITRSVKVSKNVIDEFANICKTKFPQYKQQDIITTILNNFNKKYK